MNGTMRAMSLWKEKLEGLNKEEQFKNIALLYYSAPYEWGHEIPLGTDCSGLICGPLILMGYEVRVTADQIRTKFCSDSGALKLVFFVKGGKATHVGLEMSPGVILNANGRRGTSLDTETLLTSEYPDHSVEYSYLDFRKIVRNKGLVYDLDTDLH